jgi:hypothetical protein
MNPSCMFQVPVPATSSHSLLESRCMPVHLPRSTTTRSTTTTQGLVQYAINRLI